ncbi:MAG: isoprenyl transferase [Candidatus Omnitrophica bacterium]|nr:isoprenyl transferase [Candidatus Omnitrophota bacterium]
MEQKVPVHIAIIMDGNRRWARERKLPSIMGHQAGVRSVDLVSEACARKGVKFLTLYGFSTENWKRSSLAVNALFSLIGNSLKKYLGKIRSNNIRLKVIGDAGDLPSALRKNLIAAEKETSSNNGMTLNLALNYGGRKEILEAVKRVSADLSDEGIRTLDELKFSSYLETAGMPDPDLLIRTSGEVRISNFLIWQAAYSELYFTETLWPDFGTEELEKAIEEYTRRSRRYGG